jgi:ABC-type multidrug transport system fused ATPase/permease subunit
LIKLIVKSFLYPQEVVCFHGNNGVVYCLLAHLIPSFFFKSRHLLSIYSPFFQNVSLKNKVFEKLIVTYSNNNVLLLMHIWTNIAYLNIYACRFLHNYNTQVVIFAWEEIMHKLFSDVYLHILHLQLFEFILNRPFTLSRFDSKIIQFFYKSYFPYGGQNGTHSCKCKWKDREFEYYFCIICRYLNLFKNQRIIL